MNSITFKISTISWPEEINHENSCPFSKVTNRITDLSDLQTNEVLSIDSISPSWMLWCLISSPREQMAKVFFAFATEMRESLSELILLLHSEEKRHVFLVKDENAKTVTIRDHDGCNDLLKITFEMPDRNQIVDFLSQWCLYLDKTNDLRFYNALFSEGKGQPNNVENIANIMDPCRCCLEVLHRLQPPECEGTIFVSLFSRFYLEGKVDFVLTQSTKLSMKDMYSTRRKESKPKLSRTKSAPLLIKSHSRSRRTVSQYKKRKRFISGFSSLALSITGSPPEEQKPKVLGESYSLGILNYRRAQLRVRKRRFREFCYLGISYKEVDIARILTNKVAQLYMKITFEDLRGENNRGSSEAIRLLTKSFNNTSWWVINYILNKRRKETFTFTEDVIDRKFRLTLIINVAEELRKLKNFHSFFAVMAGLNQPHLDWIWAFVKEKHKIKFQDLNRAVKSDNGYIVYLADLSKTASAFHIPYLGVTAQKLFALESLTKEKSQNIDFEMYIKRYKLMQDYLRGQSLEDSQQNIRHEAKLNAVINTQFKVVETAGEDQLLTLSKVEKKRASKGIVTRLQNSGFM